MVSVDIVEQHELQVDVISCACVVELIEFFCQAVGWVERGVVGVLLRINVFQILMMMSTQPQTDANQTQMYK